MLWTNNEGREKGLGQNPNKKAQLGDTYLSRSRTLCNFKKIASYLVNRFIKMTECPEALNLGLFTSELGGEASPLAPLRNQRPPKG